jgi:hypothetical protein
MIAFAQLLNRTTYDVGSAPGICRLGSSHDDAVHALAVVNHFK